MNGAVVIRLINEKTSLFLSIAFQQPTAPIAETRTENSLVLATSVNSTREMNFCPVARTEFFCIDSNNKTSYQNTDLTADKLSATVTSLRAYTYYNCSAKVSTMGSFSSYLSSPKSEVRRFQTKEGGWLLLFLYERKF